MKVSVVVPARDEARTLGPLLAALLGQTRKPDEVVVVDAGSTDATPAIAARYVEHGVTVAAVGPAYPGRARNRGIEAATHDWVALTDAGCVPDSRWLEHLVSAAERGNGIQVVFGRYAPDLRNEWDTAQALSVVAPARPDTGYRGPSTSSMLIHREAWRIARGFPEDLRAAEDLVFFERLEAAGIRSTSCPDAAVRWSLSAGPAATFRRLRLYSRHHLAAGLFTTWHRRVILMDLAAILLLAASLWWPQALLVGAAAGTARVFSTVARRRAATPSPYRPDRLVRVAVMLLLADLAVWAGFVDHALRRSE